jgi:uncharacterized protein (TIGR00106 family)
MKSHVVAEIALFPTDGKNGASVGRSVVKVVGVIEKSGVAHKKGAMGTTVQGTWREVIKLFSACRGALIRDHDRIYCVLLIDERKSTTHSIAHKMAAISGGRSPRLI